jgi:hypothetical protein
VLVIVDIIMHLLCVVVQLLTGAWLLTLGAG